MNTTFAWLVRREIWETRAVWIAPAICAAILVLATLVGGLQVGDVRIGNIADPGVAAKLAGLGPGAISRLSALLVLAIAVPFYITLLFTQFFYSMDALSSDRRDRSVLFWKSMPVSDTETVLSKLAVAVIVIPLAALAGAVLTQMVVYAVAAVKLSGSGLQLAESLWSVSAWGPGLLTTLYAAVAVSLWSVPLVGWLLLVSALVPRSPFLWATLPPLALALLEEVLFDTNRLFWLLADRTVGVFKAAFEGATQRGLVVRTEEGAADVPAPFDSDALALTTGLAQDALAFVTNPGLWSGLAVGAVLIAATIWARRYRDENG